MLPLQTQSCVQTVCTFGTGMHSMCYIMHCALYTVQWVGNVNNANNFDLSTRRMRDMFLLYIHLYILYIHTYIATGML